jgi:hypothetical protein
MDTKGLARYAPLMGVAAVVLWVIGVIVLESGDTPGDEAPGAEIAAYFESDSTRILLAASAVGLGSAAFIWFLGSLTARLRATDQDGRLSSIVFAAGTAAATMWACVVAPAAAGALAYDNRDRDLSPATAEVFDLLGDGFFLVAEFIAVAFMGAAALAILRGRAFPAWFGWLTALVAIVLIIGPIGWAALIFGIPIWTLIVSVWLFSARADGEAPTPAPT